jgi:hypothetical protein
MIMATDRQKMTITREMQIILENGLSFHKLGNIKEAKKIYELVLEIYPNNYEALNLLGTIYYQLHKYDKAIILISKAIKLHKKGAIFYNNRALSFYKTQNFNKAILDFKKAINLNPNYIDAYNGYANVLKDSSLWESALFLIDKAIMLNRNNIVPYVTKGIILRELNLLEESLSTLDKALSIDKTHLDAIYAKSLTLIKSGNLKEGWKLYDNRWKTKSMTRSYIKSNKPEWDGVKYYKHIFIWKEQGIGDEIMCASLINKLTKYCDKLTVQADRRLIALYKRSLNKKIEYVDETYAIENLDYDAHIPIFSLPRYFKTDANDFTNGEKYLSADPALTQSIKDKLSKQSDNKICGISWKSENIISGHSRSIDLCNFIKSLDTVNLTLVNLQYGDVTKEIKNVKNKLDITIHEIQSIDNFKDLDKLASTIEACDLVVTIDNSTVHLSGALGIETHLLLPYSSDCRWQNGSKSMWYNSLNIYSQKRDLRWDNMLKEIKHNIQ